MKEHPPHILFVGSGSIGHLSPLVAVRHALQEDFPHIKVSFVCSTKEDENSFLIEEGFSPLVLPPLTRSARLPAQLFSSMRRARSVLVHTKPSLVFSKCGAAGVPLCFLAQRRDIPLILHESDVVMGYTNIFLSRWAKVVCRGFPFEEETFGGSPYPVRHSVFTGNPIRSSVLRGTREKGLDITGFRGEKPVLLVMGGSQGAEALNKAVCASLSSLLSFCDIIHLTGKGKAAAAGQRGYFSRTLVSSELPHLFAASTIALSRAGAGAISELAAWGTPTILVPLRGVGHDHQERNARYLEARHACIVLEQEHIAVNFVEIVRGLIRNSAARIKLSENMRGFSHPDASRQIAKIIVEYLA